MKGIALLTGATGGIGAQVAKVLLEEGYEVIATGRHPSEPLSALKEAYPETLRTVFGDLTDKAFVKKLTGKGVVKEDLSVLVHCAGSAYYGIHERIPEDAIYEMGLCDLVAPMEITRALLPGLVRKKGLVLFMSSVTAKEASPHGACYGALKAGLSSFAASLFAEYRKTGLRVVSIHPDLTETGLYRHADFKPHGDFDCHLCPEDIAETVRFVLSVREGSVVTELTIRPQKLRIEKTTK